MENLPNLKDEIPVALSDKFPALISFWEASCSPCIRALPKLQLIQNAYKNKITIIGISTKKPEQVKHILLKNNSDLLNLKGNKKLLQQFEIISFPNYFLVDKKGVIIKEYPYFLDTIEKDIKALN